MEKLYIKNFKCFKNNEINLNQLTILAGANGFGKSSVIQALLLMRHTIEKFSTWTEEDVKAGNWTEEDEHIALNGAYDLALGTSSAIINQELQASEINFKITDDNNTEKLSIAFTTDSFEDQLWLALKKIIRNPDNLTPLTNREFYYLNAERVGPRVIQELKQTNFLHVGTKGELTAQVIDHERGRLKVDPERCFPESKDINLYAQVNFWLDEILPGIKVSAHVNLESLTSRLLIENSLTRNNPVLATNIGFGISYLLPIIVSGLIAKKGSYLIIENPEAHLHPRAQSKIGLFLSMIAKAGVKVVIETHSDHVINGVQIYIAQNPDFCNNATINFFTLDEEKESETRPQEKREVETVIRPITLNPKAELSDWPKGFFDQAQSDYFLLSKIRKNV